ncbi:trehalase family glycosidase [Catellatospora aurea]|uniref:Trehalase family glycosidase n=1 Tax=Catellatospora aurea TaxID=1337874 RepID=A0ABW2H231_9ACTN
MNAPQPVAALVPLDRSALPAPVLDAEPELVELYWAAWELAYQHVVTREGAPRSPYMDEGFDPDTIWIWDTCFMAHFCKYAPDLFPGVESFDNFYRPMYDGSPTSLKIHHPDNPPLFAWSEEEYVRHTGDLDRVRRLLRDKRYLQQHFAFMEGTPAGSRFPHSNIPTTVERVPRGYLWEGVTSGMDNTPRAPIQGEHGTSGGILWFDVAAQQALSARSIATLARLIGDSALAEEYDAHHARLVALVDDFWSAEHGFYFDRFAEEPHNFHRVRTPAVYWPLLAGACDAEQAAALATALADPTCFGGTVPWPSVARDDPEFRPDGMYWRGGVWVPVAYASARALADSGHHDVAHRASLDLIRHMAATWSSYSPPTIWEAYSPTRPAPSTAKDDRTPVRPDFCGWSALAPISMLIEHVLGFRVDALTRTLHYRPHLPGRTGIRNLRLADTRVTLIADDLTLTIDTDGPITLALSDRTIPLTPGHHLVERKGTFTSP